MSSGSNLTNQIISDLAGFSSLEVIGVALFSNKAPPFLYFFHRPVFPLGSPGHRVLELGHKKFIINMPDCIPNQLIAVKMHRITPFVIDVIPERLKFFLEEIVIQRIFLHLCHMAILNHTVKRMFIKDTLHQRMHAIPDMFHFLRKRSQGMILSICPILIRDMTIFVNVIIFHQIEINRICLVAGNGDGIITDPEPLACKVFRRCLSWPLIQVIPDFLLQRRNKVLIAITGNNGQLVDFLYPCAKNTLIHPVAGLIHAESKAAAHFLPLVGCRIAAMLQRADLEDIRIIPALPQGGMGENKTNRVVKRQQFLLIFQNQFVGRLIIADIRATLHFTVNLVVFFVDAEISGMGSMHIDAAQILLIRRIEQSQIFIQNRCIFLFKNPAIFRIHFVPVSIILPVILHLIDKEQGKGLDATIIQFLFLFEMGPDGLADLHPANILFTDIAQNFACVNFHAIGKCHSAPDGVNLIDMIPLILLHSFRKSIKVIIHTYDSGLPIDGLLIANFKFQARHGRFLRGYDNILQKQVAVCSPEILDIEALDLDLFDQLHPVGVQRIQNIHHIMMLLMVFLQGFLRLFAAHLLRFIKNYNGPVHCDYINRLS